MSENTKQTHCTVQYNMCASHLVCMFTVISIGVYTVIRGLNLLFGRLSEEVVFSCTSKGSSAGSLSEELLPGLNQMALSYNSGRCVECEHCTVSHIASVLVYNICTFITFFFQSKFSKQDPEFLKWFRWVFLINRELKRENKCVAARGFFITWQHNSCCYERLVTEL